MATLLLVFASLLLATMAVGLVRALRGPTPADRLLAVQLLGTASIAVLLLLATALSMPALADVALVFSLLAAVAVAALTRRRAPAAVTTTALGAGSDAEAPAELGAEATEDKTAAGIDSRIGAEPRSADSRPETVGAREDEEHSG